MPFPDQIGRYEYRGTIGVGGFASVARCYDGALDSLVQGRRGAIWAVREIHRRLEDALALGTEQGAQPALRMLSPGEEVLWDYRRSHHSTRGHPLPGA